MWSLLPYRFDIFSLFVGFTFLYFLLQSLGDGPINNLILRGHLPSFGSAEDPLISKSGSLDFALHGDLLWRNIVCIEGELVGEEKDLYDIPGDRMRFG